jgi:thiamine-monophosphate kinase
MTSEQNLIERIRRKFALHGAGGRRVRTTKDAGLRLGVRLGIGDDAAVLQPRTGTEWVVTTDAFIENVHFLLSEHPAKAVGYKALARATSDLAAMGSNPRYFVVGLAVPPTCTGKWLDNFLEGMARAARRFGLRLVGGDTTKYPAVILNLTVIGEVNRGRAILRSGARPGDLICVTGSLGEAELGWQLVQRRLHKKISWKNLLRKHLYPEPRLAVGQWLTKHRFASAMIDTSDGLSTDLGHICKASGVGAEVFAEKIPLVKVPLELQAIGLDPLRLALNGGEDYELLFTVPERLAERLPRKVEGVPVTVIGEITRNKKILLVDSGRAVGQTSRQSKKQSTELRPGGWDPFRKHS